MRPPPLPHPPGLGGLAKKARAGVPGAMEVLADAWEERGNEKIAEHMRAILTIRNSGDKEWRRKLPHHRYALERERMAADKSVHLPIFFNVDRAADPMRLTNDLGAIIRYTGNVPDLYEVRMGAYFQIASEMPGYNLRVNLDTDES